MPFFIRTDYRSASICSRRGKMRIAIRRGHYLRGFAYRFIQNPVPGVSVLLLAVKSR
jgi:hypothetical protein